MANRKSIYSEAPSRSDFEKQQMKEIERVCLKCEKKFIAPTVFIRICHNCKSGDEFKIPEVVYI